MSFRISRRELVRAAGLAAFGAPLGAFAQVPVRKLRVVVAGAHPDDPESAAGGTIARYVQAGHEVICLYLTRGEAGISGKPHEEAARIRTAEAEAACKILGARPVFGGQIDGAAEVTNERYAEFAKLLNSLQPDVVFTHFPVDTHRDHRAISVLVYDAWTRSRARFLLYYFEVMTGAQTQDFHPTDYVDITSTEALKRKACFAHASQNPEEFYSFHDKMSRFRGLECKALHAEAFVSHSQNGRTGGVLPGLTPR